MTSYIACSCNNAPYCADWGDNGLICFGACNAVAIYEPCARIGRITHTLHKHQREITTVHWIKPGNGAPESELLSGSVDGTVNIWRRNSQNNEFQCTSTLNAGSKIIFAESLQLTNNNVPLALEKVLICTGAVSGEVKLWLREDTVEVQQIQPILFEKNLLPIYCRLTYLPNTTCILLALTLHDASVRLYIKSDIPESYFIKAQHLIGHESWVISMDFTQDNYGNLFLATGSHDNMIRLWKINKIIEEPQTDELRLKSYTFAVNDKQYNVTLESVLWGHENWIYGLHWQSMKGNNCETMRLLSCSMDKTMVIWEPRDIMNGIWSETVRVGKVGGNSQGFYGCKFSPDGSHILGYGYQGSFHVWKYSQEMDEWCPRPMPGGHFSQVVDLCWEPKGRFLITASSDQTVRIHAPWKDNNYMELWHEIARPQIHGYDMTCLTMLTPQTYVSGADEKVVRIFTATITFRNQLKSLANVDDFESIQAYSASVPSLGLTNKAMNYEDMNDTDEDMKNFVTENIYEPFTEEELIKKTLWPEVNKLYRHGYEIFCVAARYDGKLLATSAKSNNKEHAAILLWDTNTWMEIQNLVYHHLTVTQMEFSPDGKYLLSVSRDRNWSLFKNIDGYHKLIAASSNDDNPHSRIIWCCSWTQDSDYFATGSRDGKVAIWSTSTIENNVIPNIILDMHNQSVTALCFAPNCITQGSYLLAIGFETGHIEIRRINIYLDNTWSVLLKYDTSQAHHLTVKRLKFRPNDNQSRDTLQLASCSSDHSVKIYNIDLSSLLSSLSLLTI
ncbi:hypothetical protein P5V15_000225 [Pogonomyrmex californicus]